MNKLSYLLASVLSALAALASNAAAAKPHSHSHKEDSNDRRATAGPDTIVVSQAARGQIRGSATTVIPQTALPNQSGQGLLPSLSTPGGPGPGKGAIKAGKSKKKGKPKKGKPKAMEAQEGAFDQSPFAEGPSSFSQSPAFTEFSKSKKRTHSKPGDDSVKNKYKKHKKKKPYKKKKP